MLKFEQPNTKLLKNLSQINIDRFMHAFNKAIKKDDFSINTGLDKFDDLSDSEFAIVSMQATADGYILKRFEDNYQTTTYQLTSIYYEY